MTATATSSKTVSAELPRNEWEDLFRTKLELDRPICDLLREAVADIVTKYAAEIDVQRRLRDTKAPILCSLSFGPEAPAPDNKMGDRAEAGRPRGFPMLSIEELQETSNRTAEPSNTRPKVTIPRCGPLTLPPGDAAALLADCRYPGQVRDLNPKGRDQINVLADIMRRAQWRSHDVIDFAEVDGRIFILNGHHRLGAQVASGRTITWTCVLHSCKTLEDMHRLYYSFDTNVRVRSNHVILAAANAAEILGLKRTTVEALFRAVPLIEVNFDFGRQIHDPVLNRVIDRRFEAMKRFQVEAAAWEKCTEDAPKLVKKRLGTQGAMAVALTCFRHQPERAEIFWGGVAQNDRLPKGDARHTYLVAMQNGADARSAQTTAKQAAVAWNAFYRGQRINSVRINTPGFRILGTPVGR